MLAALLLNGILRDPGDKPTRGDDKIKRRRYPSLARIKETITLTAAEEELLARMLPDLEQLPELGPSIVSVAPKHRRLSDSEIVAILVAAGEL